MNLYGWKSRRHKGNAAEELQEFVALRKRKISVSGSENELQILDCKFVESVFYLKCRFVGNFRRLKMRRRPTFHNLIASIGKKRIRPANIICSLNAEFRWIEKLTFAKIIRSEFAALKPYKIRRGTNFNHRNHHNGTVIPEFFTHRRTIFNNGRDELKLKSSRRITILLHRLRLIKISLTLIRG